MADAALNFYACGRCGTIRVFVAGSVGHTFCSVCQEYQTFHELELRQLMEGGILIKEKK